MLMSALRRLTDGSCSCLRSEYKYGNADNGALHMHLLRWVRWGATTLMQQNNVSTKWLEPTPAEMMRDKQVWGGAYPPCGQGDFHGAAYFRHVHCVMAHLAGPKFANVFHEYDLETNSAVYEANLGEMRKKIAASYGKAV